MTNPKQLLYRSFCSFPFWHLGAARAQLSSLKFSDILNMNTALCLSWIELVAWALWVGVFFSFAFQKPPFVFRPFLEQSESASSPGNNRITVDGRSLGSLLTQHRRFDLAAPASLSSLTNGKLFMVVYLQHKHPNHYTILAVITNIATCCNSAEGRGHVQIHFHDLFSLPAVSCALTNPSMRGANVPYVTFGTPPCQYETCDGLTEG